MTRPSPDERPTTVLPQVTVEQPTVVTAPATRFARMWRHIPSRVGRARTSTLVIGCLFVLLMAVNAALPRDAGGTVPVTTSDGRTVQVPQSYVPTDPTTTPPPASPVTTSTPASPAPATTSRPSRTSATSTAPTTAPTDERQSSTPATTSRAPNLSSTPSSSRVPSVGRAPSSSAEPSASPTPQDTSSAPTS